MCTQHGNEIEKHPFIPYGRQSVDEEDILEVINVLRSDWLTTGPKVNEFELAVSEYIGSRYAVAVSNGTAALHAAMHAAGIQKGDEVILPPMTFVATANAIVYQGGTPVFADINPETLLIDPVKAEEKITPNTKAIVAVDYAGQPCDYSALKSLSDKYNLILIADSCHSLGARYKGSAVGTLADLTVFSFHPVKHITTGEGGMVVTESKELSEKMRRFRNHGITIDHRQRMRRGIWHYEMESPGYNYRITDFQCALGINQLKKLPDWIKKRQHIAERYNAEFYDIPFIKPLSVYEGLSHAYHLYVLRVGCNGERHNRTSFFDGLRSKGIGANVHYKPVHMYQYYRNRFGYEKGYCPHAEAAYEQIISLPMFPELTDNEISRVIHAVKELSNIPDHGKGTSFSGQGEPDISCSDKIAVTLP
jgi:UDP-4-amino-4,6-dideoxy-N-acetyl-beta-L-altrosamine transaminase